MPSSRQCARPGCGNEVAAWLTYAYQARTVWIDDRDSEGDGHRLALCPAHADRLSVPVGWARRDRRSGPGKRTGPVRLLDPRGFANPAIVAPPAGVPGAAPEGSVAAPTAEVASEPGPAGAAADIPADGRPPSVLAV